MRCSIANFMNRVIRRVASGILMILFSSMLAAGAAEPRVVKDPYYGEVLFYFYQQKYFTALGNLMTSQHFNRMPQHALEAELLRGGILMSYGQHIEAGRIFELLSDDRIAPEIRNRAWFYLAKIRYQRGYLDKAEQALKYISSTLPGDLEDERQVLHALLLMNRQQYQNAAELLSKLHSRSSWVQYGRYNLGVALVKSGEVDKGVLLLEQIARAPAKTEEMLTLRDKANLALGFHQIQGGWPDLATKHLERVRIDGLLSNKALLGMGWAFSARDQQEQALVYWQELQNRNRLDIAVQESLLAVPYALGKLGAFRRSLQQFEAAINVYTREMNRLDDSIAAIRSGKLIELLLREELVEEMGWFWKLDKLPDTPESIYLAQLISSHDFQEALKNYRDLQFALKRLEQWSSNIGIYEDMLAARRDAFTGRLPAVLSSQRTQDFAKLLAARDRYHDQLTRIETESDSTALATSQEQELLTRLERIRQGLIHQLDKNDETRERYRLVRGLLIWNLDTDFKSRLWQVRTSLNELDRLLEETQARRSALLQAQQDEPRRFEAFNSRIRALSPRIKSLQNRAQELAHAQAVHLGDLAIAELRQQQERLATYLIHARFAVAQMYDKSSGTEQVPP